MDKNYSYVSLLTDDTYTYGIVLLAETLKQAESKYPLYVLVTDNVSESCLEILNEIENVNYSIVDAIPIPEDIYNFNRSLDFRLGTIWKNTWTKFKIFDLTEFSKIVFLDADIMILKNLDHLFEKPNLTAAVDGEYFHIYDEVFFNAGCMVVEPNHETFLNIIDFLTNLNYEDTKHTMLADQTILNQYFSDWPQKEELHLNKYYNIFGPYIQDDQLDDIKENAYFIHFIGRKPWTFWVYNPQEHYSEEFYSIAKEIIQNRVVSFNWPLIRSKNILTVYAICKNEIKSSKKWLKGFGQADYVCV